MKACLLVLLSTFLLVSCNQEKTGTSDDDPFAGLFPSTPIPSSPACSSTSTVINQESGNGGRGYFGGTDNTNQGQELSFSSSVSIKSIDLRLRSDQGTESLTIDIYNHSGGNPDVSGASLGSVTVGNIPTSSGWVTFEFSSPVNLPAGTYYMDLTTDANGAAGEDVIVWGEATYGADPYPGHRRFYKTEYGFWFANNGDIAMRVKACN